jgi:hypothetical protein
VINNDSIFRNVSKKIFLMSIRQILSKDCEFELITHLPKLHVDEEVSVQKPVVDDDQFHSITISYPLDHSILWDVNPQDEVQIHSFQILMEFQFLLYLLREYLLCDLQFL